MVPPEPDPSAGRGRAGASYAGNMTSTQRYEHRQVGRFAMGLLVTATVGALVGAALAGEDLGLRIVLLVVALLYLVLGLTFGRLTVTVDRKRVTVAFGSGWPRRVVPLHAITRVERFRAKWWYGWGIRRIPGGWLWNVGGFEAVRLHLDDGRTFSVGTDDPEHLEAAIAAAIAPRPSRY